MIIHISPDLQSVSYTSLFLTVFLYFNFLYFALGSLFQWSCKRLSSLGLLHKISNKEIASQQKKYEIKHSFVSIIIFSLSALFLFYLWQQGLIYLAESNWINTIIGLAILFIWNEIHFFFIHRIMHLPYFFKNVHYIHHRSKIPHVFSVFSFHWLEALLLSTVPLCVLPFINLSLSAIVLFPMVSILLNFAGHCNYRFGKGKGASWTLFGTRHQQHHSTALKQYGFASGLLDKLFIKKNYPPQK